MAMVMLAAILVLMMKMTMAMMMLTKDDLIVDSRRCIEQHNTCAVPPVTQQEGR